MHSPAHEAAQEAEDRRRQEQEDEALARAIAVSEDEMVAPGPSDVAAVCAWHAPYDRQLALSLADQELAELGSRHSRELSLLPQLLPESPLGQQLARSLSGVLAQSSERLVQPTVNRQFDHLLAPSPVSPDRSRLELRLGMYGLVERIVKARGGIADSCVLVGCDARTMQMVGSGAVGLYFGILPSRIPPQCFAGRRGLSVQSSQRPALPYAAPACLCALLHCAAAAAAPRYAHPPPLLPPPRPRKRVGTLLSCQTVAELYQEFVPGEFDAYCDAMQQLGAMW